MTERKHNAVYTAAETANKQFGQWIPTQWIELFIKALPQAAIDRLDVKADAKSQEPDAVAVKPLEWGPYPNPAFASDEVAVANVSVFGGHTYQVQRDPNAAVGYVAFLAPQFGTLFWKSKGHTTLEAAKAAAQADYEQHIRSAFIGGER